METKKPNIKPIESTRHIDLAVRAEWQKKYDPKAVQHFVKPAEVCTLCGDPMHINPEDGTEYVIDKRERKWSTHNYCVEAAVDQLDRSQQMNSRRD